MYIAYANDQALLANTSAQAKSLLHSLKQVTKVIDLYMNTDKTEFMCFRQDDAISTLNNKPLELIDHFTYLGSNISSAKSDINICIGKAWTAIDRLSTIWKSDPFDKKSRISSKQ